MFIDTKANYTGIGDFQVFETQAYKIYWRGLIYSSGVSSGLPCITKLAADLHNRNLSQLAAALRGSYLLLVHDKLSGTCYVCVDNSGLYHAFYSSVGISTSFLGLASFQGLGQNDLDPKTVVELFHFGYISFDRTLFSAIRKLEPEQIACISPDSGMSFIPKSLPSLGSPPKCSFEDLICDFTSCIAAERVSVDLTGGMDTRFLVILLHYFGLDFEVAVRGNENDLDVKIATEVAAVLVKQLHVCCPSIDSFEIEMPNVLDICDGLLDVVRSYGSLQLQYERVERGITLMLSSGGGELFRDHFWMQDFPFYSRRKANLKRLCDFRLLPTEPDHSYLAGEYRESSRGYRERFLHDLSQFEVAGNTQTYDRIIYRVRYREFIGRFVTNNTHVLQCYTPFMERDAVMYGYRLPRSARFFDYYFRKTATKYLPRAARIPTTRGYVTLSSEVTSLATDAYKYCNDKVGRIARRLGQRYFKRRYASAGKLDEPLGHPQLFPMLRRSEIVALAIVRLKDAGILQSALKIEDIENRYLGTVLTLGLVMDRLDHASRPEALIAGR